MPKVIIEQDVYLIFLLLFTFFTGASSVGIERENTKNLYDIPCRIVLTVSYDEDFTKFSSDNSHWKHHTNCCYQIDGQGS